MLRSKGDSGLFFSSGFSGESRVLSTGPFGCAGDDGSFFFFFCGLMMLPRFFFLIWGFSEEELILITSGFLGGSAI